MGSIDFSIYYSFPLALYQRFLSLYVTPNSISPEGKTIDLGCGSGTILLELKKSYRHQMMGVDISPPSIASCSKHPELGGQGDQFIECDVMTLTEKPELKNTFDLIVSYSCFHLVKGDTPSKFALLNYLAKPGAIIAIDALANIPWNRFFFGVVRALFRCGVGTLAIRVLGPILAPRMPRDYIRDLSKLTYPAHMDFPNFIDLSYFDTEEFRAHFELLRKDIVRQDGFFTGRKVRFCLRKKTTLG